MKWDGTVDTTRAICELMRLLPPIRVEGEQVSWPKAEKDKFMKAFEAILDLTYECEPEKDSSHPVA